MALSQKRKPVLGILGFGAFGRLMVQHLADHFDLKVFDPKLAPGTVLRGGATAVTRTEAAASATVVLAVPVREMAATVQAIAPHLRPGTLVLDVGSVKVGPVAVMMDGLPPGVDVIGTHPLFGPQSAQSGLAGLKVALCPVRGKKLARVARFLRRTLGLETIITTPEAHDKELAVAQGLTHLIAAVLVRMEPLPERMTTVSFDLVRRAVDMVRDDSPDVLDAIERANPFAAEVRSRFFALLAEVSAEYAERDRESAQALSLALAGS